ncbi:MAG: hypothetical protein MK212_17450 [Saprospiraceae bacterium]|nr:hypothetical protein [Saprospiraceae bacterium]
MTPTDLINSIDNSDPLAIIFYFLMLPCLAILTSKIAGTRGGNDSPYSYINSILVYSACIPGVLSIVIWLYAMLFLSENLFKISFVVYYLPVIGMTITIFILNKSCSIRQLPWFGEFYELLILIGITFACVLLIMELEILNLRNWWLVIGVFTVLFGIFRMGWERFQRMTR